MTCEDKIITMFMFIELQSLISTGFYLIQQETLRFVLKINSSPTSLKSLCDAAVQIDSIHLCLSPQTLLHFIHLLLQLRHYHLLPSTLSLPTNK